MFFWVWEGAPAGGVAGTGLARWLRAAGAKMLKASKAETAKYLFTSSLMI